MLAPAYADLCSLLKLVNSREVIREGFIEDVLLGALFKILVLRSCLLPIFALTVGIPFKLVNCREIVRQCIGRLAQFFTIVSKPAVPSELTVVSIPAHLGAEIGCQVL